VVLVVVAVFVIWKLYGYLRVVWNRLRGVRQSPEVTPSQSSGRL